MSDSGKLVKLQQRYAAAAHRVQTCIAFLGGKMLEPKHLRVGIDLAKAEQGGLAKLLIDKGLFTEEEYVEAMAQAVEEEAARGEDELSSKLGTNVTTL